MKAESRPPFVASAIPPTARMQSHGAERLFWCGRQKSPFLAPQKTQKSRPHGVPGTPQTCSERSNGLEYPRTVGGSVFRIGKDRSGTKKGNFEHASVEVGTRLELRCGGGGRLGFFAN